MAFICTARLDSDFHSNRRLTRFIVAYLMSDIVWHLNPQRKLCLPKVAHLVLRCLAPMKQVRLLTCLNSENRLRTFRPIASSHSIFRTKLSWEKLRQDPTIDGSISLSVPKYLHGRITADLRQRKSLLWLHTTPTRAFTILLAPTCIVRYHFASPMMRQRPMVRRRAPDFAFTSPLLYVS